MKKPEFSIIIPARNEEEFLPACLKSIRLSADKAKTEFEVIVVVNRCTDRTEQIALEAGCEIVETEEKNLSVIRNLGAAKAKGEFLVTIDADSTMSPGMLKQITKVMIQNKYVGGGVWMWTDRMSLGIFLTGMLLMLTVVVFDPIFGGLFFCRREDFEAIGGFDESLVSAEDIDFAKRLKIHGKNKGLKFAMLFRSYIVTSTRKFDELGDWFFIKNPGLVWTLLKGKNQEAANKIWYDFKR